MLMTFFINTCILLMRSGIDIDIIILLSLYHSATASLCMCVFDRAEPKN